MHCPECRGKTLTKSMQSMLFMCCDCGTRFSDPARFSTYVDQENRKIIDDVIRMQQQNSAVYGLHPRFMGFEDLRTAQAEPSKLEKAEQEIERQRTQMVLLQREVDRLRSDNRRLAATNMGLHADVASAQLLAGRNSAGMDSEMVRRLIQLCHPDKHSGSEASHKATDFLLKQKRS